MKSIKYISLAALGILSLSSCNDFLDTTSPSQQDATFVFSNTEDATKMINGVYVEFCQDQFTSRMSNCWMQNTDVEAMVPSAGRPSSAHRSDIWGLQAAADEGFADIYKAWNSNLLAIDRANQVIQGINESAIKDNAEIRQILGEAVCLKAYRYLLMCNFFGDVPFYNDMAVSGDVLDKPREDKFRIYSQLLQQLADVEPNMKFSDANTGGIERMPRDYAIGLIAKIALFRAGYGKTVNNEVKRADDYLDVANDASLACTYTNLAGQSVTARTHTDYVQMAKDYCQKLIQLKPRPLRADFNEIFLDENQYNVKNNDEVLYEVAFVESRGGDVGWCIGVTNTGSCAKGTTTNQVGMIPTYYMSFGDNDARRDVTCSWWAHNNDTITVASSSFGMNVGKWDRALSTHDLGSGSSKGTGINWPLMRYSEVLLMLAEAENELNGPTSLAKEQLRTVRARAFAQSADYNHDVTAYVDSVAGSKDDFFNAIVDERAWEFGGECIRRFDLIRWDLYGKKINETIKEMQDWGISTNEDLMADPTILAKYPDAAKYLNWADRLYYKITNSGHTNVKSSIVWLNQKYKVAEEDVMSAGFDIDQRSNWGSQLLGKTDTYLYNGKEYTACTKTTNNATGLVTYTLSGNNNDKITFDVGIDDVSGVQRKSVYRESDQVQRLYRGYTGGTTDGFGTGVVPYLFPIGTTTINSSGVLSNDGYGFSQTYVGDDVNVEYATVIKDY